MNPSNSNENHKNSNLNAAFSDILNIHEAGNVFSKDKKNNLSFSNIYNYQSGNSLLLEKSENLKKMYESQKLKIQIQNLEECTEIKSKLK